jgi:hypothetical protein
MRPNVSNVVEISKLCAYYAIIYILQSICRATNANICSYKHYSGSISATIYDETLYDKITLKNPKTHISTANVHLI